MKRYETRIHNTTALLLDALRLLPGIKPVREREELGVAKHQARLRGMGEVHGVPVPHDQLEQMFLHGETGSPRISPLGVRYLLRLYDEGVFEHEGNAGGTQGLELLAANAEERASILGPGYWPKRKRSRRSPKPAQLNRTVESWRIDNPLQSDQTITRYFITTHRLL